MFCSNCGKQLEDGVNFCKYCGAPTSHPETPVSEQAGTPGIKHEDRAVPVQPETTAKSTKTKVRRNVILPVALISVIVIIAGVFLARRMSGNGNDSAVDQSYAIPELPDSLGFYKYGGNGNDPFYYVEGQALVTVPNNLRDFQCAEDGTMAMQINGSGVLIYREGVQIGEIPSPVEYFYLCGSGEKIVYGTNRENSYLWDISASKSSLISDKYDSWGISYDGSTLDLGQYYSKNGQEPIWAGSNVAVMSPDGKYIYCSGLRYTTVSDDVNEYYPSVSVLVNGTSHTIFEDDSGFRDKDGWWYWPRFIAYSGDYKEILFYVYDDVFYYSADNGSEAQHVGKIKDGHLGNLLPLNQVATYTNIFSADRYSDVVSAWRSGSYGGSAMPHRPQKTLQNGVFCLLKEQNGMKSVSIVRFADNALIELIPNVTGNICLSHDGTKLWCVADGRLVFCDLAAESPHAVYCDTAYVRAYGDSGAVGISGDINYGEYGDYAMMTVPVVATSDGKTAYFVSVDGSLWMCTPDTIRNPQFITDNAFWAQCSAEDTIYLMKGEPWAYFNGTFCDLYQVGSDGEISYLYSNVVDMYMTKTDAYISVAGTSDDGPYYAECAMYCISGGGYKFICDGYRAGDVHGGWWGNN